MTWTRPVALATSSATSLALAVTSAGALLLVAPAATQARPGLASAPTAQVAQAATVEDGGPNTYLSSPPALVADSASRATRPAKPKPPPTKGTVTGQVVGPGGAPIANALVAGIRFSDLGLPIDLTEEKRVLARTDGRGRFRLPQLRQPYLVRVCSESVSGGGGGHRAVRSGECDQENSKRFTPSYLGPDGNLNSWMRHTRMFRPVAQRALGRVVVQPPAVVAGTWKGGADRLLYLTRIDGSIAAQTITDGKGGFRFEVAPGPYRLEADRHEGLRTDSTVPGYRSKRLLLRAGRTVRDSFKTRHAGIVRGLVTNNGTPLPDQFLTVLDEDGDFAAGVVTNELGRYVITSLKPGAYTVQTSFAASSYVPAAKQVTVSQQAVATADLALVRGSSVKFQPTDGVFPGANGAVDAELRNADGRVVKVHQGEAGAPVTFSGLPAGTYTLFARRGVIPSDGPEQTDFPWAQESVTVDGITTEPVVVLPLQKPTLNLSGTLPKGGQVKLTAVPQDPWLRPSHVEGDQSTPLALNWTEQETGGQYVIRGLVPGTYAAQVTTALKTRRDGSTRTGRNLAATQSVVTINGANQPHPFTAPVGAKLRGELRYARGNRPVIAPFGVRVFDSGAQSWLFPTVSRPQKYGRPFTVDRLHAGPATVRLLDLVGLYDEHEDVLIPDNLVSSARNEPGTPYWFTVKKRRVALTFGRTTDIGVMRLKIHGVNGIRAVLTGGGREG